VGSLNGCHTKNASSASSAAEQVFGFWAPCIYRPIAQAHGVAALAMGNHSSQFSRFLKVAFTSW
jgi:hypothetical protein